jgi:hypothetical protein
VKRLPRRGKSNNPILSTKAEKRRISLPTVILPLKGLPLLSESCKTELKSPATHQRSLRKEFLRSIIFSHITLFSAREHLEYTLIMKHPCLRTPHSMHTPTNPSPEKEKDAFPLELHQIDKIPPTVASSQGKTQVTKRVTP